IQLLGLDDIHAYLRDALGDAAVSPELVRAVFQRTEGNPLFIVEVVRCLRQQAVLAQQLSLPRDVPESLRALIGRMLEELDPSTRKLLSFAAVHVGEFDSNTIAEASGTPSDDVEERLRHADEVHGLVRFVREVELADGRLSQVYRFA